jgi:hypothetical protein
LGSSFLNGGVAPELADRVSPGDTVGFGFNAPVFLPVAPGQTSNVLIIETDATNFKSGSLNIIDGGVTTVAAYEPAAGNTAPEPNFLLPLCVGLLALAGFRQFAKAR